MEGPGENPGEPQPPVNCVTAKPGREARWLLTSQLLFQSETEAADCTHCSAWSGSGPLSISGSKEMAVKGVVRGLGTSRGKEGAGERKVASGSTHPEWQPLP